MNIRTINPYTQEEIKVYEVLSNEELKQALDLSESMFNTWRKSDFATREKHLTTLIELLATRKNAYAQLMTEEMGKLIRESVAELNKCISLCEFYLKESQNALRPVSVELDDTKEGHIQFDPIGAVLGIMPWNYPFWQAFRYVIPTIMAGNVALLKHAPTTTGCGQAIQALIEDSGFPKGVFQSLIIEDARVEQVIAQDIVQGVCLTGSVKAGAAVAALAGKYLKKTVMELGSADPFAILPDADLAQALDAAFTSRIQNAGQTCIAPKRIYVHEDQLTSAQAYLAAKLANLTLGNPTEGTTSLAPIAKAEFLPQLEKQLQKAVEQGATLVVGGKVKIPFLEATLMISQHKNPINQEEVFGPVLNLIPYQYEAQLIEFMNDSPYGLGAVLWTKDQEKAQNLVNLIDAGSIAVNSFLKSDPRIPFGGIKKSGYGREMGVMGIRTFTNQKSVVYYSTNQSSA